MVGPDAVLSWVSKAWVACVEFVCCKIAWWHGRGCGVSPVLECGLRLVEM